MNPDSLQAKLPSGFTCGLTDALDVQASLMIASAWDLPFTNHYRRRMNDMNLQRLGVHACSLWAGERSTDENEDRGERVKPEESGTLNLENARGVITELVQYVEGLADSSVKNTLASCDNIRQVPRR
jgi:hypothetical protein